MPTTVMSGILSSEISSQGLLRNQVTFACCVTLFDNPLFVSPPIRRLLYSSLSINHGPMKPDAPSPSSTQLVVRQS